jgi:shikimate kinase
MNKIVITGFMGSGKSTVAQALAPLLDYRMIDLDDVIKSAVGRSARQIIEEDGEPRFRDLEQQALSKLLQTSEHYVVALGGGAWISEASRLEIKEQGATSVWLDAPFSLCWKRIKGDAGQRPLARNEAEAFELFSSRTSCYELADLHIVVTEQKSATEIAAEILQAVGKRTN